jgi:hypothetical protein
MSTEDAPDLPLGMVRCPAGCRQGKVQTTLDRSHDRQPLGASGQSGCPRCGGKGYVPAPVSALTQEQITAHRWSRKQAGLVPPGDE